MTVAYKTIKISEKEQLVDFFILFQETGSKLVTAVTTNTYYYYNKEIEL